MKPLTQQILIGIGGCIAITLILGYGLSVAVNYGVSKFETQGSKILPGAPNDPAPPLTNP